MFNRPFHHKDCATIGKQDGEERDMVRFFGYEGDPAAPPTGNPNNPEGGGGPDILLAQQPLTNFPMQPLQPMDPDKEYLSNLTDPYQVRVISMLENQDYTPKQIREYLEATARDVGLS